MRYGHRLFSITIGFLGHWACASYPSANRGRPPSCFSLGTGDGFSYLRIGLRTWTRIHSRARATLCRHSVSHARPPSHGPRTPPRKGRTCRQAHARKTARVCRINGGTGILTCWPSATPFGLALGPTNPRSIAVAGESLGVRRGRFSRP